ncbi:glycosyltransferase family 25 protein [Chryseolinea lacunae]|uniref:Glycosyltransferase family 25 protein n=1 Tax=Chryseolinea lacunae TaxID=2801331 RepID=A0ABS1KSK4_9BACT|nr:glycosyltransferase family 25 protein [Chryseolinea lacunae]MBL0742440.1 glycosyltransferase family 25 protein [Chryseolinea lacunae]
MHTFAISLARSTERRTYIEKHLASRKLAFDVIDAVDGKLLTASDLEKYCDMAEVTRLRWWLTDGAIGCALSHFHVYEKIIAQNLPYAFVVEDDAVLPHNIAGLLSDIATRIKPDEVILLYYVSFKACSLSTVNKDTVQGGELLYPMDMEQPITATAYVIGHEAAKGMVRNIVPIRVTADSWNHYFIQGAFSSFRCMYPMPVQTMHFKSSIDYMDKNSWKAKFAEWVDRHKVPPFFQLLRLLRKKRSDGMLNNVALVNLPSPVFEKK